MMEDFLAKDEMGWKVSQYVIFDHKVYKYTDAEVSGRLEPHIGRRLHYIQIYEGSRTYLIGNLTMEEQRYYVDNGMHKLDLTKQLTEAKDLTGNHAALYTLLEIDKTDLNLQAKRENEMRKSRKLN